jgi:hypothetical protein
MTMPSAVVLPKAMRHSSVGVVSMMFFVSYPAMFHTRMLLSRELAAP